MPPRQRALGPASASVGSLDEPPSFTSKRFYPQIGDDPADQVRKYGENHDLLPNLNGVITSDRLPEPFFWREDHFNVGPHDWKTFHAHALRLVLEKGCDPDDIVPKPNAEVRHFKENSPRYALGATGFAAEPIIWNEATENAALYLDSLTTTGAGSRPVDTSDQPDSQQERQTEEKSRLLLLEMVRVPAVKALHDRPLLGRYDKQDNELVRWTYDMDLDPELSLHWKMGSLDREWVCKPDGSLVIRRLAATGGKPQNFRRRPILVLESKCQGQSLSKQLLQEAAEMLAMAINSQRLSDGTFPAAVDHWNAQTTLSVNINHGRFHFSRATWPAQYLWNVHNQVVDLPVDPHLLVHVRQSAELNFKVAEERVAVNEHVWNIVGWLLSAESRDSLGTLGIHGKHGPASAALTRKEFLKAESHFPGKKGRYLWAYNSPERPLPTPREQGETKRKRQPIAPVPLRLGESSSAETGSEDDDAPASVRLAKPGQSGPSTESDEERSKPAPKKRKTVLSAALSSATAARDDSGSALRSGPATPALASITATAAARGSAGGAFTAVQGPSASVAGASTSAGPASTSAGPPSTSAGPPSTSAGGASTSAASASTSAAPTTSRAATQLAATQRAASRPGRVLDLNMPIDVRVVPDYAEATRLRNAACELLHKRGSALRNGRVVRANLDAIQVRVDSFINRMTYAEAANERRQVKLQLPTDFQRTRNKAVDDVLKTDHGTLRRRVDAAIESLTFAEAYNTRINVIRQYETDKLDDLKDDRVKLGKRINAAISLMGRDEAKARAQVVHGDLQAEQERAHNDKGRQAAGLVRLFGGRDTPTDLGAALQATLDKLTDRVRELGG